MTAVVTIMDLTTRILVVDDDAGIRTLISSFLERHGFQADAACGPAEMRSMLGQRRYDLIVLDVMMPGEDGLTALRRLQKQGGPPVIMLSAVGSDIDRIVGLELGAQDYLPKPCNPRELLARIRAVLRPNMGQGGGVEVTDNVVPIRRDGRVGVSLFAGWSLDLVGRIVIDAQGQTVNLSDSEFRLLRAFVEHPRRVLSRDQLLDYANGKESDLFDRAIDVQLSRLRRKLAAHEGGSDLIRTVRSEGYMFVASVSEG